MSLQISYYPEPRCIWAACVLSELLAHQVWDCSLWCPHRLCPYKPCSCQHQSHEPCSDAQPQGAVYQAGISLALRADSSPRDAPFSPITVQWHLPQHHLHYQTSHRQDVQGARRCASSPTTTPRAAGWPA